MDEDVEVIIPDTLDDPEIGDTIYTDFSQVQIQVHGAEVAENILADSEMIDTEELDDDVEIISDDYPVRIKDELRNSMDNIEENIQTQQDTDVQEFTSIHEEIDITESDDYHEENFDNIEKIPDKDISKYEAVIEEYPDFTNVSIKEEVDSFIGTDYTDFNPDPIEEHSDNLPPEDIYHRNNVIILGTKPCKNKSNNILRALLTQRDSTEDTVIRKENLDTAVLLEDWGAYLERSQSFCNECGTLFATSNDFDAHKMIAHSFLVPVSRNVAFKSTTKPASSRKSTGAMVVKNNKNIARKSTVNKEMGSTFCNHCKKLFPDNNTLIKHLYELLTLKQFTCNICNVVFKTQEELTAHSTLHVKPEKIKIKKEMSDRTGIDKSKVKPNVIAQKKLSNLPITDLEAIPKSVLFQCPNCEVHFVTPKNGFLHYIMCRESETALNWKTKPHTCDICKRNIHYKDFDIHKKQHKLSPKFRVFKVNKHLSEKTLCKCPKCELHFSDFGINLHLRDCGKLQSIQCKKCNIFLPKNRFYVHMRMHKHQNFTPKDFLHIQYSIQRCAVKRKMEPPVIPTKKIKVEFSHESDTDKQLQTVKIKKELHSNEPLQKVSLPKSGEEYRMYFCKNCKGCCFLHRHRVIHQKKQCLSSSFKKTRIICPECGLQFSSTTMKYHKVLHQRERFSIHKVAFFDIYTVKSTIPSTPDYPQCKDCKIKFFDAKVREEHICGEDYEICTVCGDKYHNSAYNAHIEFHRIVKKSPVPKEETKLIPELMKKYKSINMMWNILYCCKKCEIVTDQYDKAVEHSQGHLNQEALTKNIKCYICNLKFDETCWSKHSELHSQMNINSKDFKILSYNPRKLLTREWYELFHSLPKEQIKQVTSKSVYNHERRFKLKVLKEGRPEFTVYCCSDCKVVCRNNEIELHINSVCRQSTEICKICSMPFSDISTLRNHQILHLKGIKKEEFRVVLFIKQQINNKTHRTYIKRKQQQIKHKPSKHKQPKLLTKRNNIFKTNEAKKKGKTCLRVDASGKYILHKCKKCKCCLHSQENIKKHNCVTSLKVQRCKDCHELFNCKSMKAHLQRHIEHRNFNANNIIFNLFCPKNKSYKNKDKFKQTQKKCKKSTEKMKNVSKTNKMSASSVSRANETVKVQEAIADSPTELKVSNASSAAKMAIVYKCDCGLHYTSLKNIEKHVQICDTETDISKEHCSKCGLLFPTDVLVSHLCKHHSKNSQFIIQQYQKDTSTVESTSESPVPTKKSHLHDCQVKLYKCRECDICFVNQNTCYKHVKNHRPIGKKYYIECKMCGLQFTVRSLSSHVSRHHSAELSLENILIEEYHVQKGKGPPKIDLYIAADKVQSFQVTSSIDESKLSDS